MKKTLLACFLGALTAATAMADVYTFDFNGSENVYGMTRQTSKVASELDLSKEVSITEAGIEFSCTDSNEEGQGFALVNAGGDNQGLYISGAFNSAIRTAPVIKLKVPGGKINGAKLVMTGYIFLSSEVSFNGTILNPEMVGTTEKGITWTDPEGIEELTITMDGTWDARYIHTLTLTYTPDLGGKKESGLSFNEESAVLIMDEDFTAPVLSNPNNLPIVWSSSDEKVATVDAQGKITAVGGGNTLIVATTEGNDSYAAGNARYELSVIPVATNLKQMLEVAPNIGDRVKVNFRATVTFAKQNTAYVIDPENNGGCFYDQRNDGSTSMSASPTIYQIGQEIAAGWIATNGTINESVVWNGLPQDEEEPVIVKVKYPIVQSVTPADADRVVILENVTFAEGPTSRDKLYGTTEDGKSYEFQNTYDIMGPKEAGKYDVTVVVRYAVVGTTVYFWLAPINFVEGGTSAVATIDADSTEARYFNLEGVEVINPENGIYVKVAGGKASKVIIK